MPIELSDEQTVAIDADGLRSLAEHVLAHHDLPADTGLGILTVDEDTMAALNSEHMGADGPTDVLAFPIDDPRDGTTVGPAVLGDVVLCPAVAHQQAREHGRTGAGEVALLLVHGILHLLGMDHDTPEAEDRMFRLTDELLASHAVTTP